MLNIRTPHERTVDKASGATKLIRETPYIRLRFAQEPPIFIQEGTFYFEDSTVIPFHQIPGWALESVDRLTETAQKEVGLHMPPPHPKSLYTDQEIPEENPEPVHREGIRIWVCDLCGEPVDSKLKGLHIARHRRAAKLEAKHGDSTR